jgi:hypothetical protein
MFVTKTFLFGSLQMQSSVVEKIFNSLFINFVQQVLMECLQWASLGTKDRVTMMGKNGPGPCCHDA